MMLDSDSLERLVPDELASGDTTGLETLDLHLARYVFATRHARPGRLLDIACGVGYGTRLLADRSEAALSALGVDISESAIAYARERYGATLRKQSIDPLLREASRRAERVSKTDTRAADTRNPGEQRCF